MIAEELKARLAEASATIAVARRALVDGKIVSLDGLEDHVDTTCKQITELPGKEGRALQPTMLALVDDLEKLAVALKGDHKETETALQGLSDRKRAQSAYLKQEKG